MIPKPGKNLCEVESYQPISLLPIMSKLFEKLILKRLKAIIAEKHLVPTHQFGFRKNHSTIDRVHRITAIFEKTLESKGVCSAVFLDIAHLSTEYGIEAYFIN
jgi:predicted metallopeptidase